MMRRILAGTIALLLSAGTPAAADCFNGAGAVYGIHPDLLRAIALTESGGRLDAHNINTNGSEDLCAMQINSWWLPKLAAYGITRDQLMTDACTCVTAGAWILAQEIQAVGYTWRAVARYHTRDEVRGAAYARRVFKNLTRLGYNDYRPIQAHP